VLREPFTTQHVNPPVIVVIEPTYGIGTIAQVGPQDADRQEPYHQQNSCQNIGLFFIHGWQSRDGDSLPIIDFIHTKEWQV
jgi:hypothetical protein